MKDDKVACFKFLLRFYGSAYSEVTGRPFTILDYPEAFKDMLIGKYENKTLDEVVLVFFNTPEAKMRIDGVPNPSEFEALGQAGFELIVHLVCIYDCTLQQAWKLRERFVKELNEFLSKYEEN